MADLKTNAGVDARPAYEMPDGSGPWTMVALLNQHEPGARGGERGVHRYVEMDDARLNRRFMYTTRADAQRAVEWWNDRLESFQDRQVSRSRHTRVHHDVDKYEVALRYDATPTTPQN